MSHLSYKTISANDETADKQWVVVDAKGQTLGRFSSAVAYMLRGKHKPNFTPHADCGDNVIIINAEAVEMSGSKMQEKEYIWHTGYPGGQRVRNAEEMMKKQPHKVLEKAVKGMLPKLNSEIKCSEIYMYMLAMSILTLRSNQPLLTLIQ